MIHLSRADLVQKIKDTKGRIFTVTVQKRTDGKIRRMNCTTAIKSKIKGTGKPFNAPKHDVTLVTDLSVREIRCIAHEGIINATIDGFDYAVKTEDLVHN